VKPIRLGRIKSIAVMLSPVEPTLLRGFGRRGLLDVATVSMACFSLVTQFVARVQTALVVSKSGFTFTPGVVVRCCTRFRRRAAAAQQPPNQNWRACLYCNILSAFLCACVFGKYSRKLENYMKN
jgi:hypothetical protein